jgi:hypothetical protein
VNIRYTDENTERLGQRLDAVRHRLESGLRSWANKYWRYTYERLRADWSMHVSLRQVQHKEFVKQPKYAIRYDWFLPEDRFYNYVDDVATRVFAKFRTETLALDLDRLPNIRKALNGK